MKKAEMNRLSPNIVLFSCSVWHKFLDNKVAESPQSQLYSHLLPHLSRQPLPHFREVRVHLPTGSLSHVLPPIRVLHSMWLASYLDKSQFPSPFYELVWFHYQLLLGEGKDMWFIPIPCLLCGV